MKALSKKIKPVVRFAPSPTGPLHIGGVRTALFNYLFAQKYQGTFILRIEDTDQVRYIAEAEDYILNTLKWLNISADEDPIKKGPRGPYRQSERKSIYKKYIQQLIAQGKAYYAFDTPAALEKLRQNLQDAKSNTPPYHAVHRTLMENSLSLPADEVQKRLKDQVPYVVRLKMPIKEEIRFYDEIRGWVKVHTHTLEDKILLKSDGMPTYHLANVVDDALMQVTHVIRGEEWLPSTPLHVLLYQYLGFAMPKFVHLPLLLKPKGKGKLSKRDAIDHHYPVFPLPWSDHINTLDFKTLGYFPEALVNFLALLGWSDGQQREILSKEALIEAFSIERIGSAGAKFDIQKAKWINQHYLQQKKDVTLIQYLNTSLAKVACKNLNISPKEILPLIKERAYFLEDLWQESKQFIFSPSTYDEVTLKKKWQPLYHTYFKAYIQRIQNTTVFDLKSIKDTIQTLAYEKKIKLGQIMPMIRIAITGVSQGPDLTQIMDCIGKEAVLCRLKNFDCLMSQPRFLNQ